jgi:tetrapyrrole methylase family protein/MazG family protein
MDPRDWIRELITVLERLRGEGGCPWDREQTHATLKRYLMEESAELLDAIDEGDDDAIADELGDLLFHVLFHCQIAAEQGRFNAQAVARKAYEKMVRRHPHVFGDAAVASSADVVDRWEEIKREERRDRPAPRSALDGVPRHLPALHQAYKTQQKAARAGFAWPGSAEAMAKADEELAELREAIAAVDDEAVGRELGDVLFALVNVGRYHNQVAEERLQDTTREFRRRFRLVEEAARAAGRRVDECSLADLCRLWEAAKRSDPRIAHT